MHGNQSSGGKGGIKSAVELAMERFGGPSGALPLSESQKKRLAEIDAEMRAKAAEMDILYAQKQAEARASGTEGLPEEIERERMTRLAELRARGEREKERVRSGT